MYVLYKSKRNRIGDDAVPFYLINRCPELEQAP